MDEHSEGCRLHLYLSESFVEIPSYTRLGNEQQVGDAESRGENVSNCAGNECGGSLVHRRVCVFTKKHFEKNEKKVVARLRKKINTIFFTFYTHSCLLAVIMFGNVSEYLYSQKMMIKAIRVLIC